MKRALVLCVVLGLLAVPALGAGPLFGVSIEPTVGSQAAIDFGWAFDSWKMVATKEAFATWYGAWSIGALWTPAWGEFDGRVGAMLGWDWQSGGLYYTDLAFIIGVQKSWGIPCLYGQFEFGTSSLLVPRVGFEVVFPLPEPADG
jgi:hypothetical protein